MGKLEAKGAHNTHISMEGEKVQLQFTPPSLDFNKWYVVWYLPWVHCLRDQAGWFSIWFCSTFGTARSEKVLVQNTYRDKSIQLLSISGTSAHVHSSLFEDKVRKYTVHAWDEQVLISWAMFLVSTDCSFLPTTITIGFFICSRCCLLYKTHLFILCLWSENWVPSSALCLFTLLRAHTNLW